MMKKRPTATQQKLIDSGAAARTLTIRYEISRYGSAARRETVKATMPDLGDGVQIMCKLRIANPPSHIQAAQGSLVAAPLARVSATVAAGKNQYMTDVQRVTNAHSRQQPRTHTSQTLERALTASNVLGGINAHPLCEIPPGARTGTLTGTVGGEHA